MRVGRRGRGERICLRSTADRPREQDAAASDAGKAAGGCNVSLRAVASCLGFEQQRCEGQGKISLERILPSTSI